MGYKPYAKYHLYETAHSGFYDGELSAKTVNLLPKTWTKFTVTDGDWKTEKTLEPLWNRDIFLANEIDKVDEDKKHHYIASSHFVIDHDNQTMYVNPFDSLYTFTDGLFYDSENYNITTNIPTKVAGVVNKIYLDNGSANYNFTKPNPQYTAWCDTSCSSAPSSYFSATLNDENIHPYFDLSYSHPTMVVMVSKAVLKYDDTICSGEWKDSKLDCFIPYPGKKYEGERFVGPTATYNDRGTTAWENASAYKVGEASSISSCFDIFDRTETNRVGDELTAGKNFISGEYGGTNMAPKYRTLYVW